MAHTAEKLMPPGAPTGGLTLKILSGPFKNVRRRYRLEEEIGRGEFGIIYSCTDVITGEQYACKSIRKSGLKSKLDVEDVQREVQVMERLKGHPAIIGIKATFEDEKSVHIIMDLCKGGDLFDHIKQNTRCTENEAAQVIQTIGSAVAHCHFKGVMHRDLKPENILMVRSVGPEANTAIKVVDFGLAAFVKSGERMTDVVGTPYYMAPEVFKGDYSQPADMWSTGVILYSMLSGMPPFWHEEEAGVYRAVTEGKYDIESGPWTDISDEAKDLVSRLLVSEPAHRLTALQFLFHPWIKEHSERTPLEIIQDAVQPSAKKLAPHPSAAVPRRRSDSMAPRSASPSVFGMRGDSEQLGSPPDSPRSADWASRAAVQGKAGISVIATRGGALEDAAETEVVYASRHGKGDSIGSASSVESRSRGGGDGEAESSGGGAGKRGGMNSFGLREGAGGGEGDGGQKESRVGGESGGGGKGRRESLMGKIGLKYLMVGHKQRGKQQACKRSESIEPQGQVRLPGGRWGRGWVGRWEDGRMGGWVLEVLDAPLHAVRDDE